MLWVDHRTTSAHGTWFVFVITGRHINTVVPNWSYWAYTSWICGLITMLMLKLYSCTCTISHTHMHISHTHIPSYGTLAGSQDSEVCGSDTAEELQLSCKTSLSLSLSLMSATFVKLFLLTCMCTIWIRPAQLSDCLFETAVSIPSRSWWDIKTNPVQWMITLALPASFFQGGVVH